jgi:ferredoxin
MKLKVVYSKEAKSLNQPIFSRAIINTGVEVNVLHAEINAEKNIMLLDVPAEGVEKFTRFMNEYKIEVIPIRGSISLDKDKCIDCGSCLSICPTDALHSEDFSIELDEAKCILCRACIKVCPVKALKMENI